VDGVKRLEKVFKLKNFVDAVEFTNKIAVIAEEQDIIRSSSPSGAGSLFSDRRYTKLFRTKKGQSDCLALPCCIAAQ
jgi:hypothetical protein